MKENTYRCEINNMTKFKCSSWHTYIHADIIYSTKELYLLNNKNILVNAYGTFSVIDSSVEGLESAKSFLMFSSAICCTGLLSFGADFLFLQLYGRKSSTRDEIRLLS